MLYLVVETPCLDSRHLTLTLILVFHTNSRGPDSLRPNLTGSELRGRILLCLPVSLRPVQPTVV